MTGIPVVSIGPSWMRVFPYGPRLFEGHEIVGAARSDDPAIGDLRPRGQLYRRHLLESHELRPDTSATAIRQRAIDLFGIDTIRPQWAAFLGALVTA